MRGRAAIEELARNGGRLGKRLLYPELVTDIIISLAGLAIFQ
ncbi:hypothetical protein L917_04090 [Phytophthora nicotianae]|uniref:Uncharacterized protein n=1 Tax=Phytophthora nicotianae TaxID=4792 RepID=W2HB38_PHYNI|nr:hypothetical protein L915_04256 [Phytophthora nicotianae]ETL98940.1 hypothetical protein L917_04090 [Phytophthora nicotianae]